MIPVLDRRGFDTSEAFHRAFCTALEGTGFAVIEGHGLEALLTTRTERAARAFFALPREARLEAAPKRWNPQATNRYRGYFPSEVDGKDGLDLGDPALGEDDVALLARDGYELNVVPDALDDLWREDVEASFAAFAQLGRALATGLVEALGGDPSRLDAALTRPDAQSTFRFNRYPRIPEAERDTPDGDGPHLSCDAHFDSGLLTLLHQDRQGGLQVRTVDGEWLDVPYRPGALILNTGRAFERLSGGRLRATLHRVVTTPEARLSIPFFLEPRWDFPIEPTAIGISRKSNDSAVTYEAFLEQAMSILPEYQAR